MVDFFSKNKGLVFFAAAAIVLVGVLITGMLPSDDSPAPIAEESERMAAAVVKETHDIGNYTILRLALGEETHIWVASPPLEAYLGDLVVVENAQKMLDFYSATLDRTFPEIYFVDAAAVVDQERNIVRRSLPPTGSTLSPESAGAGENSTEIEIPVVEPPTGGISIASLNERYAEFAGSSVQVRGTVVKASPQILGTNWYHIRDGSAEGMAGDVIFTSNEEFALGVMVRLTGKVELNSEKGEFMNFDYVVRADEIAVESSSNSETAR